MIKGCNGSPVKISEIQTNLTTPDPVTPVTPSINMSLYMHNEKATLLHGILLVFEVKLISAIRYPINVLVNNRGLPDMGGEESTYTLYRSLSLLRTDKTNTTHTLSLPP